MGSRLFGVSTVETKRSPVAALMVVDDAITRVPPPTSPPGIVLASRSLDDVPWIGMSPAAARMSCCSSVAERWRASGTFSSAFATSASTDWVTVRLMSRKGGGRTFRCMFTSSPKPSDRNGGRPASISNRMMPIE